ncbi:MAG: D-alanyl-D-alanine carboxypeptidase, partial [Lachnospiraceae bacterium]|nr:D-alanyl-D-alanine carboxypeptidase [Lachnospiraceae bacterium]
MHLLKKGAAALLIALLGFSQMVTPVRAGQVSEPVTSSSLDANWPSGPSTASETAILIEAETGTILYEKDAHKQMYPASITKLLTTLIAFEMCELDETVTFTYEALATIPYDSSRIWVDKDEYMSMEDCLAAILIMSANDVAAGVAEHIAGELDAFADIMNERAKKLGCLNSHFVNSHGYHDPDHYTTAYDMAQIGRVFFENELLCSFARERNFKHGPTDGQPDPINEWNKNKLLPTREYEYEYLVGTKTGYTSDAGQTLISCAQKDGL